MGPPLALRPWDPRDIAEAIEQEQLTERVWRTKPFFKLHFDAVEVMMKRLEKEDYGIVFGLFLHYEMRLTYDKILRLGQAAKPLLFDPYHKGKMVPAPRIVPPRSALEPIVKSVEQATGVQTAEDGLLAFKSFDVVMQELLRQSTNDVPH